jgi:hypothetical protein
VREAIGEVPHAEACLFRSLPARSREIPARPRKRPLGEQQRRALQLLAGIPFGVTESALAINGFERHTLERLIRAGLATTERENLKAGQSIGRVRITEAGRRALEGY